MAQIPEKILYVSPSFVEDPIAHEYNNIQRAIDSIPAYGRYMIMLYDNFMGVRELRLTNRNIQVKINGQSEYGIYFDPGAPICTPGDSQTLKFINMTYIRGDVITIRYDSTVGFYKCENVMARLLLIDGKYSNIYICNTKFYGVDDYPAIEIANPDTKLTICDSYVKGGGIHHAPALYFTSTSDNRVKIVNSVILHNDGIGHDPIEKSGSFLVGIRAYNNVGNEKLCSREIINYINTYNNNIADPEIDF